MTGGIARQTAPNRTSQSQERMLDLYLTLPSTPSLLSVWLRQTARRPSEEQQANVPKSSYLKPKFSYSKSGCERHSRVCPRPVSSLGVWRREDGSRRFLQCFRFSPFQFGLATLRGFNGVCSSLEIGFLDEVAPALMPIRGVFGILKLSSILTLRSACP